MDRLTVSSFVVVSFRFEKILPGVGTSKAKTAKTKTTSKEAATKGSGGDGRNSYGHGPGGDDGTGGDSSNGSGGKGNALLYANDASKTVAEGSIGLGLSLCLALPDAMAPTTQIPWPPLAATDAIRGNETTTAETAAGETDSVVTSAGETSVERGIGLRLGISRPLVVAVRP